MKVWKFFSFLLLFSVSSAQIFRVGLQAPNGEAAAIQQFDATFANIGQSLGVEFDLAAYTMDADLRQAAINGTLDFVYGGPTIIYCITVAIDIQPLASVILYQNRQQVGVISGSIISLDNSSITAPADLKGKTIAVGLLTGLTTFQSEDQYLLDNSVSLFTDSKAIVRYEKSFDILQAVLDGIVDAGFIPSDLLATVSNNASLVKTMRPMINDGQVYPSTTQAFSSSILAASSNINTTFRTRMVSALLNLHPDDFVLKVGNYAGWYVPQSALRVRRLMQQTGLLSSTDDMCVNLTTLYGAVSCPEGYTKKGDSAINSSCTEVDFVCPESKLCICSPCVKISSATHVGSLKLGAFAGIFAAIVCCIGLISFCIFLRYKSTWCFLDSRRLRLSIPPHAIGTTAKGDIQKAEYAGLTVAVKPLDHEMSRGIWAASLIPLDFLNFPTPRNTIIARVQQQKKLDHPDVVRCYGCIIRTDRVLCAVMQLAERGRLYDLLHNPLVELSMNAKLKLALDVAMAVLYLHEQRPPGVGRKLRTQHLLVNSNYGVMIKPDFATGSQLDRAGQSRALLAPELLNGAQCSVSSDSYAFGMLLYEILHGFEAYSHDEFNTIIEAVADVTADEAMYPTIQVQDLPHEISEIMHACWNVCPSLRPTFQQIRDSLAVFAGDGLTDEVFLQKQQQEALLRQMLPDHIRFDLQRNERPKPMEFECVTIMFCDIVNFTAISSGQPAKSVMDMLHVLFTTFDEICVRHKLMKVEVSGDCYIVVGNLQQPQIDHAAAVARFALEANVLAKTVSVAGSQTDFLSIRTGIHSGPVISGVIGSTVPKYTLIGDTMNVSSRMETTSEPDRIQLSETTARLIMLQDVALTSRLKRRPGSHNIKGKGPMKTFWLYTDQDLKQKNKDLHQEH